MIPVSISTAATNSSTFSIRQQLIEMGDWAKDRINKAAGFIRQFSHDLIENQSVEEELEPGAKNAKIVQASDGFFFEQLSTNSIDGGLCGQNQNDGGDVVRSSTNDLLKDPHHLTNGGGCSSREMVGISSRHNSTTNLVLNKRMMQLSLGETVKNLDDLYIEAMYTIVHKIGRADPVGEHESICYAQKAFMMDEKRHYELMDVARREKPPIMLLNVLLLEGRNLIAKDINGFSDPFAMMGVVPGQRSRRFARENGGRFSFGVSGQAATIDENGNGDDVPPLSPSSYAQAQRVERTNSGGNSTMLQRFGGSFRRKITGTAGASSKRARAYVEVEGIPVKLIKASSVQHKTLNPKWNEKFQFVVDDSTHDKFHLDIWDHDDDRSVLDAVALLNQVSGLKGLGRYFKEVTQSARAGSTDLVDDFLGSVTIRLKDLPATGIEEWFSLERRSEKSEVSGQVRLKIWLSTKEERRVSTSIGENATEESDMDIDTLDVRQHVGLIRQFALHDVRQSGQPISAFHGNLSESASNILSQHAIQGDLGELEQLMCRWIAYSGLISLGISYELLFDILDRFLAKWQPLSLDKDEENLLENSFAVFNEHCIRMIVNHLKGGKNEENDQSNDSPPASSVRLSELETFTSMLKCICLLRESTLYERLFPLKRVFQSELKERLERSANDFFQKVKQKCCQQSGNSQSAQNGGSTFACEKLAMVIRKLDEANQRIAHLDSAFRQHAGIDYLQSTYPVFCQLLFNFISLDLAPELKYILFRPPDTDDETLSIVQLHMVMNEFIGFKKLLKHQYSVIEQIDWSAPFDRAICKWLELARTKAYSRVELSCQIDASITSNEIRHTSSYVDICHIIDQMVWAWEHFKVSDLMLRVELTEKLVQTICKIAEFYTDKLMAQLAQDGFCGQLPPSLTPSLINAFCATINNIEQVRRALAIGEKLQLDDLLQLFERKTKKRANWRIQIDELLENCERYLGEQIDQSIERLVYRQSQVLKKHVFHLAWSPSACPCEQSLKPLTENLDAELSSVHRTLLHRNFVRVMYKQVGLLLKLLKDCVVENAGMEPSFYQR